MSITTIDVDELARLRTLATAATHDDLTGLLNRRGFTNAWDTSQHDPVTPHALILLDLDDFKPVNDEHGHAAGDQVLREIALRLAQVGRLPTRLGGDEFVALLPWPAYGAALRLLALLSNPIRLASGAVVRVSASIGLVTQPPPSLSVALRAADLAMYRVKYAGGRDVAVYEPAWDMPVDVGDRRRGSRAVSLRKAVVA